MKKFVQKDIRKIVIALVLMVSVAGVSMKALAVDEDAIDLNLIQGSITSKEVSVNTKIPGRIVEFYVTEGDLVNVGDPLVKISSEELEAKKLQLEAQIQQAQAGVDASAAVVEMTKANYNLSMERVEQAKAGVSASESQRDMASAVNDKAINGARTQQVIQAESAYTLWASTYERCVVLYEGGAISLQKLEEVKTQKLVAAETLSMAREGAREEDMAAAAAQLQLTEAGIDASEAALNQAIEAANIATAQITQAQAGLIASQALLSQAEAGLLEVEVYIKDTMITAPISGTVSSLNSDEGELVSTGTSIGTVSNNAECWVTVNLDETELVGIVEGAKVNINLLAYEGQIFEGTIVTINDQPDFAIKKASNENGNFDLVSYSVKILLDNQSDYLHPGMTAVVDFDA